MDIVVETFSVAERTVVRVRGEMDLETAPVVRQVLGDLITTGHLDIILDLDDVGFIDSTGLSVLVGALKRMRAQNGELQLVCSYEAILRLFRIAMPPKVFLIHDTVDQALAEFTK